MTRYCTCSATSWSIASRSHRLRSYTRWWRTQARLFPIWKRMSHRESCPSGLSGKASECVSRFEPQSHGEHKVSQRVFGETLCALSLGGSELAAGSSGKSLNEQPGVQSGDEHSDCPGERLHPSRIYKLAHLVSVAGEHHQ